MEPWRWIFRKQKNGSAEAGHEEASTAIEELLPSTDPIQRGRKVKQASEIPLF